jgi:hypothetical protein
MVGHFGGVLWGFVVAFSEIPQPLFSGKFEENYGSLKTRSHSGEISIDYPPNTNMVAIY